MDPENFVRGGPTLMLFFSVSLVDEWREDPNPGIQIPLKRAIMGPPAKRHSLRTNDAPIFNAGFAGL